MDVQLGAQKKRFMHTEKKCQYFTRAGTTRFNKFEMSGGGDVMRRALGTSYLGRGSL